MQQTAGTAARRIARRVRNVRRSAMRRPRALLAHSNCKPVQNQPPKCHATFHVFRSSPNVSARDACRQCWQCWHPKRSPCYTVLHACMHGRLQTHQRYAQEPPSRAPRSACLLHCCFDSCRPLPAQLRQLLLHPSELMLTQQGRVQKLWRRTNKARRGRLGGRPLPAKLEFNKAIVTIIVG
jgi:hypothetical protein